MTAPARRTTATASAAAVVTDGHGRVLVVNPVHNERWNLPGGHLDEGELPTAALRRELREEIGLDLEVGGLLVTAWLARPGGAHVFHVFEGPQLTPEQQQRITLQESEIGEIRFCRPEDVTADMVPPYVLPVWQAALAARRQGRPAYLELSP
ncbi:NUDIX hydrolase [Streptomyces globosus]|uniref:NUDIX hydrolase n=1 Tax=Streptomyces globosus TaxID=68209 RepID=A0A344U209_9ACTN|nr:MULTISPECIES: NUDIX hydrolase [Streptomyces]AXE24930.1 NUDIX hydrolase [Streptomyces globosus]